MSKIISYNFVVEKSSISVYESFGGEKEHEVGSLTFHKGFYRNIAEFFEWDVEIKVGKKSYFVNKQKYLEFVKKLTGNERLTLEKLQGGYLNLLNILKIVNFKKIEANIPEEEKEARKKLIDAIVKLDSDRVVELCKERSLNFKITYSDVGGEVTGTPLLFALFIAASTPFSEKEGSDYQKILNIVGHLRSNNATKKGVLKSKEGKYRISGENFCQVVGGSLIIWAKADGSLPETHVSKNASVEANGFWKISKRQ